jgi:hypothetical protein
MPGKVKETELGVYPKRLFEDTIVFARMVPKYDRGDAQAQLAR